MKTKIVALFALPLLMSSAFAAQTLTYNVNHITSGTTYPAGPAPWLIVTLSEVDSDSILLNVTSNLQNTEYFSGIGLNLTDSITYSNRSFDTYTSNGNFVNPTVSIGPDIVIGGAGIKYDVWFELETSNSGGGIKRFGSNDSFSYTLNGFSIDDFDSTNNPVGAHIQSLGDGNSAWVSSVPEPTSMLLGSLALLTLFRRRRG